MLEEGITKEALQEESMFPYENTDFVQAVVDGGIQPDSTLPSPRVETRRPFWKPQQAHRTVISPNPELLLLRGFHNSPWWLRCKLIISRFPNLLAVTLPKSGVGESYLYSLFIHDVSNSHSNYKAELLQNTFYSQGASHITYHSFIVYETISN